MPRTMFSTACPGVLFRFVWKGGRRRLWLYLANNISGARMATATQCWESHQGRPLSLEAELLILLVSGLSWNRPSEGSWKASVFGKNEDWGRWRQGPLLLPAAGWLAREGFIALATVGTQSAQNSHPFCTSKWAATGDSFVSRPTFFLKFLSPLYRKG